MAKKKTSGGRVIAVINMKGGVGKTTVSGNLFRELFRGHDLKTLLVDFDAQFNLTQLLLTRTTYEGLKGKQRTIGYVMDPEITASVYHVTAADTVDVKSVADYTHTLRHMVHNEKVQLHLVAGDFRLALFNLREKQADLKAPRDRFFAFISKAKEEFDVIVLDCNPSSSFLTRCALEAATDLLIPVRPDKYSILGVEILTDYIKSLPSVDSDISRSIVINDTTTAPEATRIIEELRAHKTLGPHVLVHTIPRSGVLAARSDYSGFAVDRKVAHKTWIKHRLQLVADEFGKKIKVVP